jgi:hypothetical protein
MAVEPIKCRAVLHPRKKKKKNPNGPVSETLGTPSGSGAKADPWTRSGQQS